MWIVSDGMAMHVSGAFTDKDDACKFCEHFCLWGTCIGYCLEQEEDMHCNDTCEKFKKGGSE